MNFLKILIEKRRERFIFNIFREYVNLVNKEKKRLLVKVITAIPLQEDMKIKITEWLRDYTKKDIQVNFMTDSQILGGIILHIGHTLIDGSLRNRLEKLKNHLLQG
jgi:F-type H+-transporting ATPase subunit delta